MIHNNFFFTFLNIKITDGPYTLFAPVNDAFKSLPEGAIAKLTANPADLKKVLLRHVFKGSISASELKTGDLTNIDGGVCKVVVSGPGNVLHIVLFMSS